jgi:uncharacterized protein (TIGR03435 family)
MRFAGLCLFLAASLAAQEARPAYEVASIKANNSADGHTGTDGWQGRIVFTNNSLRRLIAQAYRVSPFQVSGPDWLETVHFDITAKYPDDSSSADRQQMLRTLLEERFKLSTHRETKEMAGYALVPAKAGFKLTPVEKGENSTNHHSGRIESLDAKSTSMATLAELLSRFLTQPVIDRTGLEGVYDFSFRWGRDEQNAEHRAEPNSDAPPSIFTALQESLGLRLQAQKVPAEIVVVDKVERAPTEN